MLTVKLLHLFAFLLLLLPGVAHAQATVTQQLPNSGTTGTTIGALAKQTSGNAVILSTTDTTAIGVVVSETNPAASTGVTSGSANIATVGQVYCLMSAAPTFDHFVTISTSNAGYCLDTGSATYPTSGFVVGQVIGTTVGPQASTYLIRLILQQAGGGGGGGASVGSPITGGTANSPLYTDSSNNLQTNESMPFGITTTQITMPCASNTCTPNLSGASSSNQLKAVLAGTTTMANPTNPLVGQVFTLQIQQPASGGPYTIGTWGTGYSWVAGSAPTLATGVNAVTLVSCQVLATTPTMQCYGPVASAASTGNISAATAPSSTSIFQMQGFAGTDYGCTGCSFTPKTSGTVAISIQSTVNNTSGTVNVGLACQISVGTGTAPTKNTALTGTQIGTVLEYTNPAAVTAASVNAPYSQSALVTGLTVGTTYWVDDACESITTASAASLANINVVIKE